MAVATALDTALTCTSPVPGVGFEPTCPEGRPVLSRLRQPVAPSGRTATTLVGLRLHGARLAAREVRVAQREQRRERIDGRLLARLAGVDLEVEVRPGRVARHPDVADDVARPDQALRRV